MYQRHSFDTIERERERERMYGREWKMGQTYWVRREGMEKRGKWVESIKKEVMLIPS
jgi:hypothetical protein